MQEATELGKRARELKKAAEALHQEERSGAKGRTWRKNVKAVEKVCLFHYLLTMLLDLRNVAISVYLTHVLAIHYLLS